jgi:hypothetical protein
MHQGPGVEASKVHGSGSICMQPLQLLQEASCFITFDFQRDGQPIRQHCDHGGGRMRGLVIYRIFIPGGTSGLSACCTWSTR